MSLPVRPEPDGRIHPVSQVTEEITAIFSEMGFVVAEGPDVENDFNNFAALNIPPEHPARQMMDTFYLEAEQDGEPVVLRTHTSPVQIRTMLAGPPPYRIIAPGRTYRRDSDMTHTPMFHQVEGLLIDRRSHMGHLKGCLTDFVRAFFERDDIPVRFRPSYFPFTEPSAEMDIGCRRGGGELVVGEGSDWLEILGCGMVHPNVLRAVEVDPEVWQGFAFGMGIDRVAMLKYGIPDLRTFFEADLRWLRHYGFAAARRTDQLWRAVAMKLTLPWLKEHLATEASLGEIVEQLTMLGLEVEAVEKRGADLSPFRVAQVTEVRRSSRRRAPQRLPGRYRRARGRGGVRRAERARRHESRVRAGRRHHPGQR